MQVNAIISATTQGGKKINTTISYLRPNQKSKAQELATALNALTTNTYQSVQINEINVDPAGKPVPTLEVGAWSGTTTSTATITYTGDGQLFCNCSSLARIEGNTITVNSSSFSGQIFATETDNYSSVTRNISR